MPSTKLIRSTVCALAVGTLAFAASAGSAYAADCSNADAAPSAANLEQVRSAVLCLHNADRAARHLPALKESPKLRKAALGHSSDMVSDAYFGHTSLAGATFVDRILRAGYARRDESWTLGENLAWGTGDLGTARGIEDAWMHSSGHKANILKPGYREVGIGIRLGVPTDGTVGATFTVDFGAKS
jgi:uncharacterized protein YkwD